MLIDYVVAFLICKMERMWGRVALQKLLYLVKERGVPIECNFGMHILGPFSIEVANSYDIWEAKGIFKGEYVSSAYCFTKGINCEKFVTEGQTAYKKYGKTLEDVISNFKNLQPRELELFATVHFINKRLKESGADTSEKNVIHEVIGEKGKKFTDEEVDNSYRKLKELSMI
jgi:uncharacterized protein YwgA